MDERQYVEMDGLELAERVRGSEVSAAEVLEVARARADRLNPAINAFATRAWTSGRRNERRARCRGRSPACRSC
jgi:Asp-tRNA(Asn)/Glu-tRNA(Gln) amidotransferase A subunit family amidase